MGHLALLFPIRRQKWGVDEGGADKQPLVLPARTNSRLFFLPAGRSETGIGSRAARGYLTFLCTVLTDFEARRSRGNDDVFAAPHLSTIEDPMQTTACRAVKLSSAVLAAAIAWLPGQLSAEEMDLIAPEYYGMSWSPQSEWQSLETDWPATGSNSMIIVNPDSGPGGGPDSGLYTNVSNLLSMNSRRPPKILGYVDMPATFDQCGFATMSRTTSQITADVDNWVSWYGPLLSGIFFDDVARDDPNNGSTYSADISEIEYVLMYTLSTYHFPLVVLNAAGNYVTTERLFNCGINIAQSNGTQIVIVTMETYENLNTVPGATSDINTHASDFGPGGALNWVHNYPASNFAGIVHNGTAGSVLSDLQALASYNAGFSFVTDGAEPMPWEPGPSDSIWTALSNNTGEGVSWSFADGTTGGYDGRCPPPMDSTDPRLGTPCCCTGSPPLPACCS